MQLSFDFRPQPKPLTVLSWGMGQESTDIAVRIVTDKAWEKKYRDPSNDILVVASDTGAEWPSEWKWAGEFIERFLKPNGIKVKILAHETFPYRDWVPEDCLVYGFHKAPPLVEWFTKSCGIPTRNRRSCTDRKKIAVIRRYVSHLTNEMYGLDNTHWMKNVQSPHRMLIGFGAEEGGRVDRALKDSGVKYVVNDFPLYNAELTRAMSVQSIAKVGLGVPHKSGCFCCTYQPIKWYWALKQMHPELWNQTLYMEQNALNSNPKLYLQGTKTIDQQVMLWEMKQLQAQGKLPDPHDILYDAYMTKSCW